MPTITRIGPQPPHPLHLGPCCVSLPLHADIFFPGCHLFIARLTFSPSLHPPFPSLPPTQPRKPPPSFSQPGCVQHPPGPGRDAWCQHPLKSTGGEIWGCPSGTSPLPFCEEQLRAKPPAQTGRNPCWGSAAPALEAAAGLCVGGICQRAAGCEGKGEPEQLLCQSIDCIPASGCLAAGKFHLFPPKQQDLVPTESPVTCSQGPWGPQTPLFGGSLLQHAKEMIFLCQASGRFPSPWKSPCFHQPGVFEGCPSCWGCRSRPQAAAGTPGRASHPPQTLTSQQPAPCRPCCSNYSSGTPRGALRPNYNRSLARAQSMPLTEASERQIHAPTPGRRRWPRWGCPHTTAPTPQTPGAGVKHGAKTSLPHLGQPHGVTTVCSKVQDARGHLHLVLSIPSTVHGFYG